MSGWQRFQQTAYKWTGHLTKGSLLWRWKPTSGFLLPAWEDQACSDFPMTHSLLAIWLRVWPPWSSPQHFVPEQEPGLVPTDARHVPGERRG